METINYLLNSYISKEMYAKMGKKPVNLILPVTAGKSFLPVNQLTGYEIKSLSANPFLSMILLTH